MAIRFLMEMPEDHGPNGWNKAQRRIAAAVEEKGLSLACLRIHLSGKLIHEPSIERPGRVAVLVPMSGEPRGMVWPIGGHANFLLREVVRLG